MKLPSVQVRRKPRQSRAKFTQQALQDSFVQLLQHRTADKITIREITDLAGVGLGTFYEYFSKKEDLIALTIHLQVKHHAEDFIQYAQHLIHHTPTLSLPCYLQQMITYQVAQIEAQQFLWSQTFLLERQVSTIDVYRKSYHMMIGMWNSVLLHFYPHQAQRELLALNLQRLCYGFISQSLLIEPNFKDWLSLKHQMIDIAQLLACCSSTNHSIEI